MKFGFVKTAAAVSQITVGDCHANAASIISTAEDSVAAGAEIILFPELCVTSSTCGDLIGQPFFIQQCENAVADIAASTANHNAILVVGAPVCYRNSLYNCAIVLHNGRIAGIVAKSILSNRYGDNESRHFASGSAIPYGSCTTFAGQETAIGTGLIFSTPGFTFGIEIGNEASAPLAPATSLATAGAELILNPSAIGETAGYNTTLRQTIMAQSSRLKCGYLHANSGWGESTSKVSYSGYACIAECGCIIADAERFQTTSHITISEIDIEKIRKERIKDTSFAYHSDTPYIYI